MRGKRLEIADSGRHFNAVQSDSKVRLWAVRDSAERLTQTCSPGGFDLGINGQPVDLRRQTISWLGFRFGLAGTSVVLHLADDALERLRGSLKTDFDARKTSVSAWHVPGGWLTSMGPAVGRGSCEQRWGG